MATRKSRQGSNPERNIAIHEAGQAVVAFFQHQRIVRATIIPTTDTLGHVLHAPLKFADRGMFDESLRGIDRAEKRIWQPAAANRQAFQQGDWQKMADCRPMCVSSRVRRPYEMSNQNPGASGHHP
jgi:hypothetical protein